MKVIGLIAEYNPLHLGHIYQINKIKELYPNSIIILITNSCFTQRGDISILNKWNKTKLCLENNIDLIVELPFAYATQSADIFAKGALTILNHLKIDTLIFGSESNNINILTKIVDTQLNNKDYNNLVKKYLNQGINYPTAMSKALQEILNYTITEPNDLLGISYIKEIMSNNYNIAQISIKRIGSYHEKEITNNIISASLIRTLHLEKKDITNHIPKNTEKYLYNISLENYFPYLKYKILSSNNLSIYQTVDEGIENRIKKFILTSNSYNELMLKIKTKRYTYNKLNRMFTHILCNFTKEEAKSFNNIEYIRILGFNTNGRNYLNKVKKNVRIPIITNFSSIKNKMLDLELRTTCVYASILSNEEATKLIEMEYKNYPIMY